MKKILTMFFLCLASFLSAFFDNNFIFTLPLFTFAILSGLKYFIGSLLSLSISYIYLLLKKTDVAINSLAILTCSLVCFFTMYYIFLFFKKKLVINYFFSSFIAILSGIIIKHIFLNNFQVILFLQDLLITIILCYAFSFLLINFSFQNKQINNQNSLIITTFLLIIYFSIFPYLLYLIFPILIFYGLHSNFKNTLVLLSSLFLFNTLINNSLISNYYLLFASLTIILSFNIKGNKFTNFILVIFVFTFYYFLFNKDKISLYLSYGIVSSISSLFFNKQYYTQKDNYLKLAYLNSKKEINYQLLNFKDMFTSLATNFEKARRSSILIKVKYEVFDTLCSNCPKLDFCHQKGKHLLLDYLNDSLANTLTEDKIRYIRQNCLKQNAYFTLLDKFTHTYLINQYQNEIGAKTKEYVATNFTSFAKIMEKCKDNIANNKYILANELYSSLKDALSAYNYDVVFVNNYSSEDKFAFDIAISNITKKQIKEQLLPIINNLLHCKMKILSMSVATISFSYYLISICEESKLKIRYSLKQSNIDYHCNGDSFSIIDNPNDFYLAISDGMGHGFDANEESMFALSTLSCFLKSKIDCIDSVILTNEILQLKNDFQTYSTLDLIRIDKQEKKAEFYKLGAFTSYILRNKQLISIDNYALPIGIINDVNLHPLIVPIEKNDIIIMCSDGMIDDTNSDIANILSSIELDSANIICQTLFEKLIMIRNNHDDATLAIITIN